MDNSNISQPTEGQLAYQTLGKKVFWMFFLQSSPLAFCLLLISIILAFLSSQPFLANTFFGDMQANALWAALLVFLLSLAIIAVSLALSWLNYINYTFLMAEDSFKIKRGVFNKTENAIPYRQLQNVDIERSLFFQMLGLSRLIILTAGHEDDKSNMGDEAEGIIPAIDSKLAIWLQTELLKRADVQKTVEINNNIRPLENGTTGKN